MNSQMQDGPSSPHVSDAQHPPAASLPPELLDPALEDEDPIEPDWISTQPILAVEPGASLNPSGSHTQILDSGKPLSQCLLWQMLEDYYTQLGISAWDSVPFYPTSNAFIGDTYASLVISFLLDHRDRFDRSQPIYILELAAGSGCFSFFFLQALERKLEGLESLKDLRIRYVMSDFAEKNVQVWEMRGEFQPFLEKGMLDFAVYRPEDERSLTLRHSKETLSRDSIVNPMVTLANYFFDSLRQDIFRIEGQSLNAGRVTLYRYLQAAATGSPISFDQVKVREDYVPVEGAYYGDPLLDQILESYIGEHDPISVLYPLGTLRCLQNLQYMSGDRLVVISSDKGFTHPAFQHGLKKHWFTVHGSISYMVNYDAIRRFFELQGGSAIHTAEGDLVVVTGMYTLLGPGASHELLHHTFRERLVHQNTIHDLFSTHALVKEMSDSEDLFRGMLGLMRLSSWDPLVFEGWASRLYEVIRELDNRQKVQIMLTLPHVRANTFPLRGAHYRALYWVGKLYYGLEQFEAALDVFAESLERVSADDSNTYYYMGACYEMLNDERKALEFYLRARAFDPECRTTKGAITRVQLRLVAQALHGAEESEDEGVTDSDDSLSEEGAAAAEASEPVPAPGQE